MIDLGGRFAVDERWVSSLYLVGFEAVKRLALFAQGGILQVAFLTAGAAHEHGVHAFCVVLRQRRGTLRRFVVGVRVHGEKRQTISHPAQDTGASDRVRSGDRDTTDDTPPTSHPRQPADAARCCALPAWDTP